MRLDPPAFAYSIVLLASLSHVSAWIAPWHDLSEKGCVIGYVYDGDTVELKCRGESVTARLQGFDAPETKSPGCAAEAELGQRTTERLRELVTQGPLTLETVGEDKYGRLLARMTLQERDVADILIEDGLAVTYSGGARINWCERLGA
ncbi:MAG: thermonuclease family protein [Pseudomonadota bacterium]